MKCKRNGRCRGIIEALHRRALEKILTEILQEARPKYEQGSSGHKSRRFLPCQSTQSTEFLGATFLNFLLLFRAQLRRNSRQLSLNMLRYIPKIVGITIRNLLKPFFRNPLLHDDPFLGLFNV
jgi:hypothetical protein